MEHYEKTYKLYDLMYQEKDYEKEVDFIKKIIKKNFLNRSISILDMACGTGNHLNLLSKEYSDLTGVDSNLELLKIAKYKVKVANFIQDCMQNYSSINRYDLILCLFSSIHYNKNEEDLEKTLNNFYKSLRVGGIAIIDFISEEKLRQREISKRDFGAFKLKGENIPNKKTSLYKMVAYIDNKKIIETSELGVFNKKSIINLSKKIGFEILNIVSSAMDKKKFYLILKKKSPKIIPNGENILNSIVISLTNRCNFKCKYCFQDSGIGCIGEEMDTDTVKMILNKFKKLSRESFVQFTGGEPMIRKDFFDLVKYALSLGYVVRFSTNGRMLNKINKSKLDLLKSNNVYIKISLDGSKEEVHEKYRDRGSFVKIIKGIKKLRKHTKNLCIKSVISKQNIHDIKSLLKLCDDLKINNFTYNILRNQGRGKGLECVTNHEVFKEIFFILKENPKYIKYLFSSDFVAMYLVYHMEEYSIHHKYYYFINYDGLIYPNQSLIDKKFILGNVKDKLEFDIGKFNSIKNDLFNKDCLYCRMFNFCNNRIISKELNMGSSCEDFKKTMVFISKNLNSNIFKNILDEFNKRLI